nr:Ethanolamine utilization protein EutK precursor [Klebsiella pneumoniae]
MPFSILPVILYSVRNGGAMINALGLLEVEGMVAAVDAADAMLKAANVRLLSHEVLDPGRLTLVVEGDLAACRAALDAGAAAARRTGCVISRREIGRPEEDTQRLIGGFQPPPPAPMPPADPASSEALLTLLASVRQGMTAGEVAAHFARRWIRPAGAGAAGTLRKRSTKTRSRFVSNLHHLCCEALPEDTVLTPQVEIDNIHQRHTTDVYEHALTITARQQIYDQLHPGQFRGEFTEILLDEIRSSANIPGWRCASPARSGRTPSGLAFRRPG